jgi:hypothetical protein
MNLSFRDLTETGRDRDIHTEIEEINRLFSKYPEVRYMPLMGPTTDKFGGQTKLHHPAYKYLAKYKSYKKKGYAEHKAREMAEQELEAALEK